MDHRVYLDKIHYLQYCIKRFAIVQNVYSKFNANTPGINWH